MKRQNWMILPVLLAVLLVSLHFCLWKQGMFIDEIYTYGLSNSHNMPYIGNGTGEHLSEQLLTREDFFDYLAVTENEPRFDLQSVRTNQAADVHPPLYYWIINFCSSLVPGHFSKWIGLIPDLLIYLGTVLLLYVLAKTLWPAEAEGAGSFPAAAIPALVALLYGLSVVGLSTMLMIRMYVLMAFWTVLLALLTVREWRAPGVVNEISVGWCICLGLMTQYYFVFYAFFLCAFTVIGLLLRRAWKAALRFSLFAFAGVALMLLWFPDCIRQLTADKLVSGGNALENLENLSAWPGRLRYYIGQVTHGMPAAVLTGIVALVAGIIPLRSDARRGAPPPSGATKLYSGFWLIVLPVIPAVCTAAVLSPVVEGRYVYNVMPICALAAGACLNLLRRRPKLLTAVCALSALLALGLSLKMTPDYIYDGHRLYNEIADEHAEDPCVYLTDYYSPVIQDMLQLMRFEDVYVTADTASEGLREYLEERSADSDACVVYVDTDSYWSSGFNPQEKLEELLAETDYTDAEHLYKYANSDTWLLTRTRRN